MSQENRHYDTSPGGFRQENTVQKFTTAQYLGQLMRQGEEPLEQATIEQPSLLAKTVRVRKKDEKIMELIARTGISLDALIRWKEPAIESFCKLAESNRANEAVREPVFVL
jgi:hypothetical protein